MGTHGSFSHGMLALLLRLYTHVLTRRFDRRLVRPWLMVCSLSLEGCPPETLSEVLLPLLVCHGEDAFLCDLMRFDAFRCTPDARG